MPLLLATFGLLLAAGCAGTNGGSRAPTQSYDPLLGGPPAPRAGARADLLPPTTPGAAPSATAQNTIPPPPVPVTTTSTAALAAGAVPPLGGGAGQLRIGSNPPPATGRRGPSAAPSVALNRPEPAPDAPSRPAATPTSFTPAGTSAITTYEQAQAQLTARGIRWQRLETGGEPGEWRFACSVPHRGNPNLSRTYEGRAADPLAAIRAVLEQIDRDR